MLWAQSGFDLLLGVVELQRSARAMQAADAITYCILEYRKNWDVMASTARDFLAIFEDV